MPGYGRFFASFAAATILIVALCAPARADDLGQARQFVRDLADRAISQLTDPKLDQQERESTFRTLLEQHFDVAALGKSALGRYWRVATDGEKTEYLRLFEDLIVSTYANKFRDYAGENLDIVNVVRANGNGDAMIVVQSQIARDAAKPIRVDWRVARDDGASKIADVVVEGVSMVQTQRSEFSSVIIRNGNKVAGLIEELRGKVHSLQAPAN